VAVNDTRAPHISHPRLQNPNPISNHPSNPISLNQSFNFRQIIYTKPFPLHLSLTSDPERSLNLDFPVSTNEEALNLTHVLIRPKLK